MECAGHRIRYGAVAVAAIIAVLVLPAGSASAKSDDSFLVETGPGRCAQYGIAGFVDHGEHGDDYAQVYDACDDNVGVKAWVWLDGKLVGAQRNGHDLSVIYFDPFPRGNVKPKQYVGIKVCAQKGKNGTPFACGSRTKKIVDG